MDKKLNFTGTLMSILGALPVLFYEAVLVFLTFDIKVDQTEELRITFLAIFGCALIFNLIAFLLNFVLIFFSKNAEKYEKKAPLIITTIIFNFINFAFMIYMAVSGGLDETFFMIAILTLALVFLVGNILILIELIKSKKQKKIVDNI